MALVLSTNKLERTMHDYDVEEVPSLELTDEELSLVSGGGVYLLGAKADGVVKEQTHLNRIEL
jgi:bacteriocin-like protein